MIRVILATLALTTLGVSPADTCDVPTLTVHEDCGYSNPQPQHTLKTVGPAYDPIWRGIIV